MPGKCWGILFTALAPCFLRSPSSLPFSKCSRVIIVLGRPYLVTTEKLFTVSNFCQDKTQSIKKALNHHPPAPFLRALPPPQALELPGGPGLSSPGPSLAVTHPLGLSANSQRVSASPFLGELCRAPPVTAILKQHLLLFH